MVASVAGWLFMKGVGTGFCFLSLLLYCLFSFAFILARRRVLLSLAFSFRLLWLLSPAASLGKETPPTLNKEWQEETNARQKANKANPITGISSPGYKGPGYVTV